MNLPNILTMARVFLIPIFLFVLFVQVFPHPYGQCLAAVIFIVAAMTDGLDGYLARSRRQISRFGKFMDPVADKLLISSALMLFAGAGQDPVFTGDYYNRQRNSGKRVKIPGGF